ncbi:MAG: FAD-binding oxidoreductase, partial [Gammaproteobacteria bacterium]|nr:FAD-binding oxidoreductase [Gammaproteobacteria bacterium]
GIATGFEFKLHSVGPMVNGGVIAFSFEDTVRSLCFLRGLAEDPDDELTAVSSLTHAPDGSGRKLAA